MRVKGKDLATKAEWASAKERARAGDFLALFASKSPLQLKPKLVTCLRL